MQSTPWDLHSEVMTGTVAKQIQSMQHSYHVPCNQLLFTKEQSSQFWHLASWTLKEVHCFLQFEYVARHYSEEVDPGCQWFEMARGKAYSVCIYMQRRSGTAWVNYSTRTSATSSLFNLTHQGCMRIQQGTLLETNKPQQGAGIHHPMFWLEV